MSSDHETASAAAAGAFDLPCPHAAGGIPSDRTMPDYEPLTRDQVAALLDRAASAQGDAVAVAKLQVRLGQALPGNTCPRQAEGTVADREARLGALFVERYREGGTPKLTSAVWSILTEGLPS